MDTSVRWMVLCAALGLLAAYALWGRAPRPKPPGAKPPVQAKQTPPVPESAKTGAPADVPPDAGRPVSALAFDPPELDFGALLPLKSRALEMRIVNPTGTDIRIEAAKGSCGCIRLEMKEFLVPAGKSVPLTVHFTALLGQRPPFYTITFDTNEPGNARGTLKVLGSTKHIFRVVPDVLFFPAVKDELPPPATATIARVDGKPFVLRGVTVNAPEFRARPEPADGKAHAEFKVTVDVLALRKESFTGVAGVLTDDAELPLVELKLSVRQVAVAEAQVAVAQAQLDAQGRPAAFLIPVERRGPGGLRVEKVSERSGRAVTFVAEATGAGTALVRVALTNPAEWTDENGELELVVSGDPRPLRVPYRLRAPQVPDHGKN